jgi:uncharacterized protein YjbI with pentapeptide repeats
MMQFVSLTSRIEILYSKIMLNKYKNFLPVILAFFAGTFLSSLAVIVYANGSDPNLIHSCVNGSGSIRIVGLGVNCGSGETPLNWNSKGLPGTGSLMTNNLVNAGLDKSDFRYRDFQSDNLSGATLTNSQFENANLNNTNLTGTDFTFSSLDNATVIGATLSNTNFNHATAIGANFTGDVYWIQKAGHDPT